MGYGGGRIVVRGTVRSTVSDEREERWIETKRVSLVILALQGDDGRMMFSKAKEECRVIVRKGGREE